MSPLFTMSSYLRVWVTDAHNSNVTLDFIVHMGAG